MREEPRQPAEFVGRIVKVELFGGRRLGRVTIMDHYYEGDEPVLVIGRAKQKIYFLSEIAKIEDAWFYWDNIRPGYQEDPSGRDGEEGDDV